MRSTVIFLSAEDSDRARQVDWSEKVTQQETIYAVWGYHAARDFYVVWSIRLCKELRRHAPRKCFAFDRTC